MDTLRNVDLLIVDLTCPTCDGVGTLYNDDPELGPGNGSRGAPCARCDGSGEVDPEPCELCEMEDADTIADAIPGERVCPRHADELRSIGRIPTLEIGGAS